MVLTPELVVSSRLRPLSLSSPDDTDIGGIQITGLLDPGHGEPWIGRPRAPCDPEAAVLRALKFEECRDHPRVHRSGFSITKLFLVATGLHAAAGDHARLAALVERAARLWAAETQLALGQQPTFYCAELVAYAYQLHFPRAELKPAGVPLPTEQAGPADSLLDWGERIEGFLAGIAREVTDHTAEQWDSLLDVIDDIARHDLAFAAKCLGFLWELATFVDSHPAVAGVSDTPTDQTSSLPHPPPASDDAGAVHGDDSLPYSLVTPRMLADLGSATGWLEWVRPLVH